MKIGNAGSDNVNLLFSDQYTYRNEDYVVSQAGSFTYGIQRTGGASAYSYIGLWNPSGSGVTLIADEYAVSVDTVGVFHLGMMSVTMATDEGNGTNNLLGGMSSKGVCYSDQIATHLGDIITKFFIQGCSPYTKRMNYGYIIPEETGLYLGNTNINDGLTGEFRWREI